MSSSTDDLRIEAARCRRLAHGIGDEQTRERLNALAEACEKRAAAASRDAAPDRCDEGAAPEAGRPAHD